MGSGVKISDADVRTSRPQVSRALGCATGESLMPLSEAFPKGIFFHFIFVLFCFSTVLSCLL